MSVQDRPSDAKPQARDYKLFPPQVSEGTADWEKGMTINEMPLNAAICDPEPFANLKAGTVTLRGWAVATARQVARVDVSVDGGRNWRQAELQHDSAAPWSWTLWTMQVALPPGGA
ncbi:Ig-like domain-containing protein [Belnapia arida]|uniref:Ig-like domain-containing protein n=1 Tax=Belnapia arida TaxID=2804533 RepID=UPI002E2A5FE2|nr:Ig-like domain-containing protein [Belnapia arida]